MSDACTCPTTELIRAAIQGHIDTAVRAERERIARAIDATRSAELDWTPQHLWALECAAAIARQEPTP